jgi:antitoxin component HigA of HigAB toxin-antitoxin module
MPKTLSPHVRKDDYLSLVRMLPLKAIRADADHAAALKVSGRLIGMKRKLTAGESQYLDVLSLLIREYERAGNRTKLPRAGGTDVLKHLLAEHGMTQKELAHLLSVGESAASMILAGTRELTKSHIDRLSRHFGVGVGAFFG